MIGLLVVAAGLRLCGINFGLPALYRPDEDVTVGRAMGIFHGILDPHFADWPHLYFYVAAAWLAPFRLVFLLIVVAPLAHDIRYDLLIQQTDTRTLAFDWLAQHVPTGSRAAVPYMAGPAHDQAMIASGEHSHGATDPYVASFLDSRLETQYTIRELTRQDLQLTSLDSFRKKGIVYIAVGYETPGTGCRADSPLERTLRAQAPPVASFAPTNGCPDSVFDQIDTYYVPLAGYSGWVRPGPYIRIYRLAG